MATDYLKQAGVSIQPGGSTASLYSELNTYLSALSPSDRAAAIKSIQAINNPAAGGILGGVLTGGLGVLAPLSTDQLTQILANVKKQYQPAPAAQSQNGRVAQQASAAQQQAVTAATATTAQLPEFTTGETGAGIPVVGAAGGPNIPGTNLAPDFNNELQNYYATEFQAAGNDPNALAQLAGMDPQALQSQYQSYLSGWQKATQQFRPGIAGGTLGGQQPMSLIEFAQNKAQSMIGPWAAVMDAINGIWQSQTNSPLPMGLMQQILTALNGMPMTQRENVLYEASLYMSNKAQSVANKGLFDQTGTLAAAILGALPSTILGYSPTGGTGTNTGSFTSAGIVGTALQSAPFLVQQQTTSAIDTAFENALHRAPTAADLAALGSTPTQGQITAYINEQPVPGTGMTYGAYSTAQSNLTSLWESYFGKEPSIAQLKWSVGKSPEDIQSFINNSNSSIPGVTIGQKNDYQTLIDGFDKGTSTAQGGYHGLSAQIDDSLMQQLHTQITKASTGTTSPGKM